MRLLAIGKKTRLLVLTEFLTSIVLIKLCWTGNTIPDCFSESRTVLRVKSLRLLIPMTLEGLFDHLTHFAR